MRATLLLTLVLLTSTAVALPGREIVLGGDFISLTGDTAAQALVGEGGSVWYDFAAVQPVIQCPGEVEYSWLLIDAAGSVHRPITREQGDRIQFRGDGPTHAFLANAPGTPAEVRFFASAYCPQTGFGPLAEIATITVTP